MRLSVRNHRGLTLVELMVVVAIIALLTSVATGQYRKYKAKVRQTAGRIVASQLLKMAASNENLPISIDIADNTWTSPPPYECLSNAVYTIAGLRVSCNTSYRYQLYNSPLGMTVVALGLPTPIGRICGGCFAPGGSNAIPDGFRIDSNGTMDDDLCSVLGSPPCPGDYDCYKACF